MERYEPIFDPKVNYYQTYAILKRSREQVGCAFNQTRPLVLSMAWLAFFLLVLVWIWFIKSLKG